MKRERERERRSGTGEIERRIKRLKGKRKSENKRAREVR